MSDDDLTLGERAWKEGFEAGKAFVRSTLPLTRNVLPDEIDEDPADPAPEDADLVRRVAEAAWRASRMSPEELDELDPRSKESWFRLARAVLAEMAKEEPGSLLDWYEKVCREIGEKAIALQSELAAARATIADLESVCRERAQALASCAGELSDAKAAIATLETELRKANEYCADRDRFERDLAAVTRERDELVTDKAGLYRSLTIVAGERDSLTRELAEEKEEVSRQVGFVSALTRELAEVREELRRYQSGALVESEQAEEIEKLRARLSDIGDALHWLVNGGDDIYPVELDQREVHWHNYDEDSGISVEHDNTTDGIVSALVEAFRDRGADTVERMANYRKPDAHRARQKPDSGGEKLKGASGVDVRAGSKPSADAQPAAPGSTLGSGGERACVTEEPPVGCGTFRAYPEKTMAELEEHIVKERACVTWFTCPGCSRTARLSGPGGDEHIWCDVCTASEMRICARPQSSVAGSVALESAEQDTSMSTGGSAGSSAEPHSSIGANAASGSEPEDCVADEGPPRVGDVVRVDEIPEWGEAAELRARGVGYTVGCEYVVAELRGNVQALIDAGRHVRNGIFLLVTHERQSEGCWCYVTVIRRAQPAPQAEAKPLLGPHAEDVAELKRRVSAVEDWLERFTGQPVHKWKREKFNAERSRS